MLGDFLITVVWLFFWTMALMIFISVFSDVFRREDLTGAMKAVWILVIFILPFLGCLIYMIVRPKVTAQGCCGRIRAGRLRHGHEYRRREGFASYQSYPGIGTRIRRKVT